MIEFIHVVEGKHRLTVLVPTTRLIPTLPSDLNRSLELYVKPNVPRRLKSQICQSLLSLVSVGQTDGVYSTVCHPCCTVQAAIYKSGGGLAGDEANHSLHWLYNHKECQVWVDLHTCITLMVSALCISVSLDSFFLRTATLRSRCSLCLAYSACMSVSAAWSALAVWGHE